MTNTLNTKLERIVHSKSLTSHVMSDNEHCVPQRESSDANAEFDCVLVHTVVRALCDTGYPAHRDIQIEIQRGIVVLLGRVPTYHQKLLAQVTVQQVKGVRGIANGLEVVCGR